ncbi:MAG: GlsB/YeaQ/YmgE family stress response membrane protein [Micromonosporaceae bacterium]
MLTFLVVLVIVGLIAGVIARLLVPGRDPMGILATMALGIVGSFIGGFLENLIQYHTLSVKNFHPAGLIGSVIGAIVLLLLLRLTGRERGRRYHRSRI